MLQDILLNINWVDLIIFCIIGRSVYIGIRKGFVVELFKLVGILFASFIAIHYSVRAGAALHKYLWVPASVQNAGALILIATLVVIIFKLFRDGWLLLVKTEAHPILDRWGGLLLGLIRCYVLCGLIFSILCVTQNAYIQKKARESFTGLYFINVSSTLYSALFDTVIAKLFPTEKKNTAIVTLKETDKQK